jgi:hypothetical protein
MKFGVVTAITDESIRPDVLAKAVEDRGFESLVVAEHSHIPVSVIVPDVVDRAVLDAYRQHGAERALILLSTKPESATLQLKGHRAKCAECVSVATH